MWQYLKVPDLNKNWCTEVQYVLLGSWVAKVFMTCLHVVLIHAHWGCSRRNPWENFSRLICPQRPICWQMLMHVSCLGSWVGDVLDANGSCGCDSGTGFVAMQNLPESEDDDEEEGDEEIEVQMRRELRCMQLFYDVLCCSTWIGRLHAGLRFMPDHAWYACTLSKGINCHMLPPRWVLWYYWACRVGLLPSGGSFTCHWEEGQFLPGHLICASHVQPEPYFFFTSETDHFTCFHFLLWHGGGWSRFRKDAGNETRRGQTYVKMMLKCKVGKHLFVYFRNSEQVEAETLHPWQEQAL